MMDIVVPEIYCAHKKYDKIISGVYLVLILQLNLEFLRHVFKKYRNTNFTKIRSVAAGWFHAEGRPDG